MNHRCCYHSVCYGSVLAGAHTHTHAMNVIEQLIRESVNHCTSLYNETLMLHGHQQDKAVSISWKTKQSGDAHVCCGLHATHTSVLCIVTFHPCTHSSTLQHVQFFSGSIIWVGFSFSIHKKSRPLFPMPPCFFFF